MECVVYFSISGIKKIFVLVCIMFVGACSLETNDGFDEIVEDLEVVPPAPGTSTPPPPSAPVAKSSTFIETKEQSAAFLMRATFGGKPQEIENLTQTNAADWIAAEFQKPAPEYLAPVVEQLRSEENVQTGAAQHIVWDNMITSDDQLRQRMIFALSQILATSDRSDGLRPHMLAHYIQMISDNAFGNYRDLLEDITYSPQTAHYLTYFANSKGDPETGRMPDENYAREILQLFTIGLTELNMDGTQKLNAEGNPIEVYTNEDIMGLAKVFTGFAYKGRRYTPSFRDRDSEYSKLVIWDDYHSQREKTFLGLTIAANTPGEESVDRALDHIFNHPNVAPFISRQLIQRFTASHPSPEYVERVATAFETGRFVSPDGQIFGDGRRGDLKATISAILLEPSLFEENLEQAEFAGKIREPVLRFTHWARAFEVQNVSAKNDIYMRDTSENASNSLGQHPFRAPSVFNNYRPGFIAPGTEAGQAKMTSPEFQLVNENTTVTYANFMTNFVFDRTYSRIEGDDTFHAPYAREVLLAHDSFALMDHLSDLMTAGRMSEERKGEIAEIIHFMNLRDEKIDEDRMKRVKTAILLTTLSPDYTIQF